MVKLSSARSQLETIISLLSSAFTPGFMGGLFAVALHKFPVTFTATRKVTEAMAKGLAGCLAMNLVPVNKKELYQVVTGRKYPPQILKLLPPIA